MSCFTVGRRNNKFYKKNNNVYQVNKQLLGLLQKGTNTHFPMPNVETGRELETNLPN